MNKLSILFIILLFGSFTFLNAQTYDVTFQVDMNVKMVTGEFDSLRQDVRITGQVTDPQWDPATAPILVDPDQDGVFETTLSLAADTYAYKYLIGDAWGNDETLDGDRSITVSATETLDPVFYSNVTEVDFPAAPQDSVILMLTLDMSRQRQIGAFDPNTQVVRCAGAMQGWSPENAPDMVDYPVGNENLVYQVTYEVDPSTVYEYKFLIGTAWGGDEANNRSVSVAANDTAIWPVYFNDEPYDPDFVPDSIAVTFNVDMSIKILEGLFDPATEAVVAAGSFQAWQPALADSMVVAYDSVFTSTVKMLANVDYEYKFKIGRSAEDTGWETDNRQFSAGGEDTVLATVFFDNDTIVSEIVDGTIEFIVDLSVLEELGLYDATKDSLQLRGDFNGWSDSDPTKALMNQNILNPNQWFLEIAFEQTPIEEIKFFKFYVDTVSESVAGWTDGWERPLTHGGGNRMVAFEGTDTQTYFAMYDDVQTDYVLNGGVNLQVTFNVDMRPAIVGGVQATPFNPDADTLWWIGEQPIFVASQGWVDSDNIKELYFEDLDGDSIYSGTLTVLEPSFNAFEYRYGYYSESAEGWQLEPTGYANFASRVRYAGQDAARSWPVNPWPMPQDVWTPQEVKDDQQEVDPYQSYEDYLATSIGDLAEVTPNRFKLYKNYPNPFNPSTNLKFDLPEAGVVKLNIYNVLGQKVATVYNGNLKAGQHIMTWSGKDVYGSLVATGVYFFRLETEKHVAVRKMVMLK